MGVRVVRDSCARTLLALVVMLAAGSAAAETVRDEFNAVSFAGNDGTVSWSTSWQETKEGNGPTKGRLRVVSSGFCAVGNCLRIGGDGENIDGRALLREADLSAALSATLTFSYRRELLGAAAGTVALEVSPDGGSSWIPLQVYPLDGTDAAQVPQSYDLTAFLAANTQIQFIGSGKDVASHFFADNVEIAFATGAALLKISHDGTGIHCLAEPIDLSALDAGGSPIASYAESVTLDTQTGTGTWSSAPGNAGVFSDPVPGDGLASYTFDPADGGTATFLLEYQTGPATIDVDAFETGDPAVRDDDTEGPLSFGASGFTVTANPLANPPPNPINDPLPDQTAGAPFPLYLTAYGTTDTDPTCGVIETYAGAKTLRFWSTYVDPGAGPLAVTIDGVAIAASEPASAPQAVAFTNGQASVLAKYKDVGRIRIDLKDDTVSDPPGGLRGGTNAFVVRPDDFAITAVERADSSPNPGTTIPSGPIFVAAGAPFRVTVEARDAEGDRTPSFGTEAVPEGLLLTASTLVAPAGGRNGTGDDGAIGNGTAFSAIAPAGTFRGTTFYWDEVGAIRLQASVADGDYLGSGDVNGSESGPVGRFTPFDLDVALNAPSFATACAVGSFTYVGEPFAYATQPLLTFTARNAQGTTTSNYTGAWLRLRTADLTGLTHAAATGTVLPAVPALPTLADLGTGSGTLLFENDATLAFQRGAPVAPFDADIAVQLNVQDEDGVAYAANPASFGVPTPGNGIAWDNGAEQRYGRLRMENAHGSEQGPLAVPFTAQYFDGAVFRLHASDSCTPMATAFLGQTPVPGTLTSTPTLNATLAAGDAGLVMGVPNEVGYVDLVYDLGPAGADRSWLRYDWNGDLVFDDNPSGRATFGIYRGDDRMIWRREIY